MESAGRRQSRVATKTGTDLPTLFDGDDNEDNDASTAVALKDLWNYYDPIHVARTECNPDPTAYACLSSVDDPNIRSVLTDDEFAKLETLVHRAEQLKYGLSTAENMLGSNLLWQILNRSSQPGRFFLYSAHAPTIIGLLSTLKNWDIGELFVDYGSAIVVEIYEGPLTDVSIRIVYKASSSPNATPLSLSHIGCNGSSISSGGQELKICPMENLVRWAKENTHTSVEDWCKACENTSSDVCLLSSAGPWALLEEETHATDLELIFGTFFGGFAAGLISMFLCITLSNAFCGKDQREPVLSSNADERATGTAGSKDYAEGDTDEKSLASLT